MFGNLGIVLWEDFDVKLSSRCIHENFTNFYEEEYPKMQNRFPRIWKDIKLDPIGVKITDERVGNFSREFILWLKDAKRRRLDWRNAPLEA